MSAPRLIGLCCRCDKHRELNPFSASCASGCHTDPAPDGAAGPPRGSPDGSKLRWLDLARMVAEKPPPVPYRVDRLLVDGALTMMFGQPGEGKSLLAAVLAKAVANFDTVADLTARQGMVIYIDAENGEWEIHRRVHTLELAGGAYGISFLSPLIISTLTV